MLTEQERDDLRRVAEELATVVKQVANNNGRCDFCCADIAEGEPHDQFCIIPPALASAARVGIGVKK